MLDLVAAAAVAVAAGCVIPANLTPAPVVPQEQQRLLPVTSYVIAYYWWPQECRRGDEQGSPACAAGFGLKVHGLWPDGANRTYPQFCRVPTPIDLATVRAQYCTTPSPALMQHEWAKHGTCNRPSAADYFARERKVAATIVLPEIDRLPTAGLTAGSLRDSIVAANASVPRDAVFIGTDPRQWLTEVRVCLNLAYQPTACDAGIGAADGIPVRIWPRQAAASVAPPHPGSLP